MPVRQFGGQQQVEPGTILMWSGLLSDIPSGWVICDGNNGTPNLLDDFTRGVSDSATAPGGTGGVDSYTLSGSQLSSHDHGGSTGTTGSHSHGWPTNGGNHNDTDEGTWWPLNGAGNDNNSSTNGSHSHSANTNNTGGSSSVDNRPAFYKVAFIQKL